MDGGGTPKKWSRRGDRTVADCAVFKVIGRTFEHPDGRKSEFFINESPDWVQCAALARDGAGRLCAVMVEQFRFGVERMSLEFPGGVMDAGEDPVAGAVRELREETGYSGENARLVASYSPNPAIQNNLAHFVIVENCRTTSGTHLDENEEISSVLVPVDSLDGLVKSGRIFHAIAIASVYFLQRELSEC